MKSTYKAKTTIYAEPDAVWAAMTETDFTKDYFPEIKKDLSAMGEYVQRTHQRRDTVSPDYAIPGQAMGWTTGASTKIRIPRKDVEANIQAIDVQIVLRGENTQIAIEVTFDPEFNTNLVFVCHCVRAMVNAKLKALKQDIETNCRVDWDAVMA